MRLVRTHASPLLVVLVAALLLPALVWGIQALNQDSSPAPPDQPAATADPPRHGGLGCTGACETEPPPVSKPKKERNQPEPRSGRVVAGAMSATAECTAACETGTIESLGEVTAPAETENRVKAQGVIDLVGTLPPLARTIPIDRLDEVEERLGRIVDETLDETELPDDLPDAPTEILDDALVPDGVETLPGLEIALDPAPVEPKPIPDPGPPPAVDPPAEPVPDPKDEDPAAVLVTDEETAEKLGIARRMTITLSPQVVRALAILSERNGLELTATAADSAASSRD